jgi:hypothetical protein
MGKRGLEPLRLSARDPKSRLSANSSTSPRRGIIPQRETWVIIGPEVPLGRVIHLDSAGKDRTRLIRSVVLALRELMRQNETDSQTYDLAAFIALALLEIHQTIDASVGAWEKRGYWVKADRFRMDWAWAETLGTTMKKAVLADDWMSVARVSAQIAERLNSTKVPQRSRLGAPWVGAWEQLKKNSPGP